MRADVAGAGGTAGERAGGLYSAGGGVDWWEMANETGQSTSAEPVAAALEALRDLGTVEELTALADGGAGAAARLKVNSHVHLPPNFSAFESVGQVVDLAAEQGLDVLGVSNYYDYAVYGDFAAEARKRRIFPLFGLEIIALVDEMVRSGVRINDPGNPGRLYICGKGITRFASFTPRAAEIIDIIRRNDVARMRTMIGRLKGVLERRGLKVDLDYDAIVDGVVRRHGCPRGRVYLQERHLAQALQEYVFAHVAAAGRPARLAALLGAAPAAPGDPVQVQNDIRSSLMKAGKLAFVDETFVDFDQARSLILELGGIPCYPTLADGAKAICEFEQPVEELIGRIKAWGIHMAELIPIRNQPDVLRRYVTAMRRAGLAVAGGTEHNTLDLLGMEPTCAAGQDVPGEVRAIFREGACVIVAHQFLMLHGRCGFVDGSGRCNAAYGSDEARISAFRRLGGAVIARYQEQA